MRGDYRWIGEQKTFSRLGEITRMPEALRTHRVRGDAMGIASILNGFFRSGLTLVYHPSRTDLVDDCLTCCSIARGSEMIPPQDPLSYFISIYKGGWAHAHWIDTLIAPYVSEWEVKL